MAEPMKLGIVVPGTKPTSKFNPNGQDYDYDRAISSGMGPAASGPNAGHWGSVAPVTTQEMATHGLPEGSSIMLKGSLHPTWDKAIAAENARGSNIQKRGDRYFSVPQPSNKQLFELLDSLKSEQNSNLTVSIDNAVKSNSDVAAADQKLSSEIGLPPDVVARNREKIHQDLRASRIKEIADNGMNPALKKLFADPEFAKIAHPDADGLSVVEQSARAIKAVGSGAVGSLLGGGIKGTGTIINDLAYFQTGDKNLKLGSPIYEVGQSIEDFSKKYLRPSGNLNKIEQVAEGVGQAGGQVALWLLSPAAKVTSLSLMLGQGATAMEEMIKNDPVSRTASEVDKAAQRLTGAAITAVTNTLATKFFISAPQTLALSNKWLHHSITVGLGAGVEGITELAENVLHDMAGAMTNPESKIKWAEAQDAGEIGAYVGAIVQSIANAALHIKANKQKSEFERLQTAGGEQGLKQKSPDAYNKFSDSVAAHMANTTDGPITDVYIDRNTFKQALTDNKIDPVEVGKAIPSIGAQVDSVDVGGDIVIPMNDWIGKVVGTDIGAMLSPHARGSVDAPSLSEVQQATAMQPEMSEQILAAIAKKQTNDAFVKSSHEVQDIMFQQLKQTGRYADPVSRINAQFVRDFVVTQAANQNVMPMDFFNKYMYKVTAEGQAQYNQDAVAATDIISQTQEFKDWFGNSVVKNAEGKPTVLFHGTADNVTDFDPNHPNRKDTGWLGTGAYLTDSTEAADLYAQQKAKGITGQNVMPVYARLENPYTATKEEKAAVKAGGRAAADAFTKKLMDAGHDGVIYQMSPDAKEIVVFNPAGVKSVFNEGTWSLETKNLLKQPVKLKPVPTTLDDLANVEAAFNFAASQTFATNRDFKVALQERVLSAAKAAKVDLTEFTEAVEQYLVRVALADAVTALETNPNAVGWYNEKVTKALRIVSLIHPEINTDPQAKFAFTWALAVTSNGLKVTKNFELAERAYAIYKETGKMPVNIQAGQAQIAINESLGMFNDLIDKYGFDVVEKFMTTKQAVKQVIEFTGRKVSGENLTTEVYGAAALGPKIGNGFFANLYGHFEQLTMDRWLMRTWGRWTGTLLDDNKANIKVKQTQLKATIQAMSAADKKAFESIIKTKLSATKLNEVAEAIQKASMKPENRKQMGMIGALDDAARIKVDEIYGPAKKGTLRVSMGDQLRKVGNSLALYLDGQKEAPSGPPERARIRKVMSQVLIKLQEQFPSLTMSDVQALLWYPEKRLYDSAKTSEEGATGYEDDEAPDYANAAAALAKEKGIPEDKINQTIKDVDNELSTITAERARGAERNIRDSILRQGIGTTTPAADERTGLLRQPVSGQQDARGGFDPTTLTTILGTEADNSTFLHETAHFFLSVYADMAANPNATEQSKQDMQTVLDWFGVKDLDTWNQMSLDEQRKYHEQFAYNYEIYLFEGKAPNIKLQTIFDRFSAWLARVYKSIRDDLNAIYRQEHGIDLPILTGEVRQVMDRMLATSEQIKQTETVRNMVPIFQTQEQSGMDDSEWAAYQEMSQEATNAAIGEMQTASLRQMKWLSGARSRVLKEMQKETAEIRKSLRDKVVNEVMADPVYRAITWIRSGETVGADGSIFRVDGGHLLSFNALTDMYGDAAEFAVPGFAPVSGMFDWSGLKSKKLVTGKGTLHDGIHPDIVAEMFGFKSGDDLVRALVSARKFNDEVNVRTDERMLAEHAELQDPKSIEVAVESAIHNEARARFVSVELRHLAKATAPVRVMLEAARQAAVAILASRPIGTIKPKNYAIAEARAAQEAINALKKGDTAGAMEAKRNQLLNNQLASEAIKVNRSVAKSLDLFKKVFTADSRIADKRDMNLVSAARAILANYGLGKTELPAGAYLAKVQEYDPEFYAEIEPMITAHLQQAKPITELTTDQFTDLSEQIQALWHLSRRSKQMEIDGKMVDRNLIISELVDRVDVVDTKKERRGYDKAMSDWDKRKIMLMGARAAMRRVESWVDAMDGGKLDGPFRKYIWNPISEAVAEYRIAKNEYLQKYLDIVKSVEKGLSAGSIAAGEIGYTFKNKAELLHAILHTGNESNKRKMLLGRGWAEENQDGSLNTARWDNFMSRMYAENKLSKVDFDFAQSVWDLLEEMKPAAQKVHKDMYGFYFNEISANPVITPFGIYRGGYVPAVTDPWINTDAAMRNEQETGQTDNSYMFPTTGRGFTKGRVEYNKPLMLDLGYFPSHLDKVLRFTYIEPKVKDVAKIVKTSQTFSAAMDRLDPTIRGDMLVPWLQRTAMQMIKTPMKGAGGKLADKFFSEVRTRTGMQMMVGNVTNALQQVTGLSIGALKVKPGNLRNALWLYTRQPTDTSTMVAEKSKYMNTRMSNQQFEISKTIDELLLNPSKYDKLRSFAGKHGYFMQQGLQNAVDTIVWVGAYNQSMTETGNERDAVRAADSAVRLTQGSFSPEDVSRFETGTAFVRAFTMFYSYFNMQANLLGTEFTKTVKEFGVKKGMGQLLYIYTFAFMIPAVLSEIIVQGAGGFADGDDDEWDENDAMALFFGSQARTAIAMIPIVGPSIMAGVNAWNSKPYDDRISTSASISALESTVRAPNTLYKAIAEDGSWKKAIRDTLTALGMITGLPLGQMGKPLGYAADIAQGRVNPESAMDVTRGVISGKDVNRPNQ